MALSIHQQAVQHALIEQVTQYLANYTPDPLIVSYAVDEQGNVMGKFSSQNRVFTFRLTSKGLVYKPFVDRQDGEDAYMYKRRFDSASQEYLTRIDAPYKPPSTPTAKKKRGTKQNPVCGTTSYHCGVCISLGKNCIKAANTTVLKERLSKISSLAKMAHSGGVAPRVKTGVIGAKVDPKSLMKKAQEQAKAVASKDKTTTQQTHKALTGKSFKKLEKGEVITDHDTYAVHKKGDKYEITNPQEFEGKAKLVDKAGLVQHFKELDNQPKKLKESSSMNPAIPISKDPDTVIRALRDGRLVGDAKQGYEIQEHPTEKGKYLITSMPNKKGDYSGVLDKSELKAFVKGGGDASRFNRERQKAPHEQTAKEYIESKMNKPDLTFGDTVKTPDNKVGVIKGTHGTRNNESVVGIVDKQGKLIGRYTKSELADMPNINNAKRDTPIGKAVMANAKEVEDFQTKHAEDLALVNRTNKFKKALASGKIDQTAYDKNVSDRNILSKEQHDKLKHLPNELQAIRDKDLDLGSVTLGHKRAIKIALAQGKTVPPEVLKDYPDLQPKKTFVKGGGDASRFNKEKNNSGGTFLGSNPRNAEKQKALLADLEVSKKAKFKYGEGDKASVVTGSGDRAKAIDVGVLNSYIENGEKRYTVYPKGKKNSVGTHFWVKEEDLTSNEPKIPLPSDKTLTTTTKKAPKSTSQLHTDRTRDDIRRATQAMNKLDDSIKKVKAGKGVMSEADLKKITQLEKQKAEFATQKANHQAKLDKLTGKETATPAHNLTSEHINNIEAVAGKRAASALVDHPDKAKVVALSEEINKLKKESSKDQDQWRDPSPEYTKRSEARHKRLGEIKDELRGMVKKDEPEVKGSGNTEAERRQYLLNTNTEESKKFVEPKREIELADVKTPSDHIKYATQELNIAKASKDPERINKWIDELQRAKKKHMNSLQMANNTHQPDLFFVNKGDPAQRSLFDSARTDAEYDDNVEQNILYNLGSMISRAITGNQTSPNTVQLRKVAYKDDAFSGIFTQYGEQYDFEISNKGVVISPLQVRQDRIGEIAYKKTAKTASNRKCGKGYKCKGSCINKSNKCRVNWASKEGLAQFKTMQDELSKLTSPKFIQIDGRQIPHRNTSEENDKTLALARHLANARQARKEHGEQHKEQTKKFIAKVDAKVAEKLKEHGLNVNKVKSTLGELDPKDIAVDPKRFQYKITGEHTASGTVGSLQGVNKWDENLAGILQVWKDPADGKTYVVNGHNRLSKANELNADKVAVRYLDVPSAKEARTIGAMTNIAEGHGTALDAAKFFRDTNWTKEDVMKRGIPLKEKVATDGLAIASLEPNLFRQVIDGELPMQRAAIIGGNGLSHEKQKSLMDLLAKRKTVNNDVLNELVDTVKHAGQKQEQQFDLFGNNTHTVDLAVHRAALQAHIKNKLASEKKLFGTVSKSKSAKDLERGGNTIDVDKSGEIADQAATALKIFDTIKHHVGGVSDALNDASEKLASAKNKTEQNQIKKETYEKVLKAVQHENDKLKPKRDSLLFRREKTDSRQRTNSSNLRRDTKEIMTKKTRKDDLTDSYYLDDTSKDQVMTFVTDNSGNKMGIVQLGGIRYKFVKPIFGSVMLTPVSETPLNYLFQAPDLTLPQGDLLDQVVPKDPLQDLLGAFNSDSKRTKSGEPNAETRTKFGDKKGKYPIFDLQSLKSAIALRGHSPNPEEILDRAEEWAKLKGNKAALAMVAKAQMVDKLKAKV